MPENLEIIVVEVLKLRAKSFFINTWYSPPDASLQLFDDYEKCLQTMDLEELEIVRTGDFKCDWFRQNEKIQTKK